MIPAGLLLIASGFAGCEDYVPESFGFDARGLCGGCDTENERIFVLGDIRTAASLAATTITDGCRAAKWAGSYLMKYVE